MIRPGRLQDAAELMDESQDPIVLDRTLHDLAAVNRWLGGVRAVRTAIEPWLRPGRTLSILDIGCGGGDVALAIEVFARNSGTPTAITAVDSNPAIARIARERTRVATSVKVGCASAFALPFRDRSFDLSVMSLTLHHFSATEGARVVHEMARVTRRAVIVNELERNWQNYTGARLLAATLWRNSPHTRHDGPVSVLRAFTKDELARALEDDLLRPARVQRYFFYRLVAVAERKPAAPAAAITVSAQ
jgi:ubiquinone/menaquinone biosynthesis C-methylase UbiE